MTCALMRLDFYPKGTAPARSDREILERIILPPSCGRDKHRSYLSGLVLPRRKRLA